MTTKGVLAGTQDCRVLMPRPLWSASSGLISEKYPRPTLRSRAVSLCGGHAGISVSVGSERQ